MSEHVIVDEDLCTGNGRCYSLAPNLFSPDEGGYTQPAGVPVEAERETAELVVQNCPEGAIKRVAATD